MDRTITQRELRNDSAAVLRDVENGETLIVTRNGTPVAELRPLGRQSFVPRERLVRAARAAPKIDYRRFREDLDAFADDGVEM